MVGEKKLKGLLLVISLLFIFACNNGLQNEVLTAEESKIEIALERVSAMGFDTEGYQIAGDGIIVEGDIVLNIDDLLSESSRQYKYVGRDVSANDIANVKLCNSLGSSWDNAFKNAINEWNSVSDTKVRLLYKNYYGRYYTASEADIHIFYDSSKFETGTNAAGLGDYPSTSGKIGDKLNVNLGNRTVAGYNDYQKKKLLMHEIGHCIGFPHQDGSSSATTSYIQGTPLVGYDNYSIMAQDNYDYFETRDPKFTSGDKKMIQLLYPSNSNTPYVDIFEHSDFKGLSYRLYEGTTRLPFNDKLSSMKLYNDAFILVYEDTNYRGKCFAYNVSSYDYRGHWFNDKASSIKMGDLIYTGDTVLNNTFSYSNGWNRSSLYHYSKPYKLYTGNFAISGKCEAYVSGGVLHTYITDRGNNVEDIYFKTSDLTFDHSFTYEISFKARTEAGHNRWIKVAAGEGFCSDPYEEEYFKIDGNMNSYTLTFRPNNYTSNGSLMFYMGDTYWDSYSLDVVLDDIKVTRIQ